MKKKPSDVGAGSPSRRSRRKVAVLACLLFSLVATSLLLLALAPSPLLPDVARTLVATDQDQLIDQAMETRVALRSEHWHYIYIHHSKSAGGDAASMGGKTGGMGDHFLIGNGRGCGDGEIQAGYRWDQQQAAQPAAAEVTDDCISICLIGDFDQAPPTARQLRRLEELVAGLRARFEIQPESIVAYDRPGSAAGIGRHFPPASFLQRTGQ